VTQGVLVEEINKMRRQGYAIDNQENEIEGRCLGAAIAGADGRVLVALSISGPVFRMSLERCALAGARVEKDLRGHCGADPVESVR
jgi:DNA-binding IclR family transcriptional regulator